MHLYLGRLRAVALALTGATLLAGTGLASAVTFAITPAIVSNTYSGAITLNIGGLTNGEQVSVQKFIDLNGNGAVDPGEPLVDAFKITDGGAFVIGGVTNINVPFDTDSGAGSITTKLHIAAPRTLQNLVGQYIFRLASPLQNFAPTNLTLTVTNAAVGQYVTGIIYSNGVAPQPYAVVAILSASGNGNGNWAAGGVADSAGRYRVSLNPGSYMMIPALPGYFTDQSLGAQFNLTNGMSATNNLFLTNGTLTISGTVYDAATSNKLAGAMIPLEQQGGNFFAISFTDTNGLYSAGVGPANWKVKIDSDQATQRAYLVPQNKVQVNTTTGSVANVNIGLSKATALFYGAFTNASGAPMANIGLSAQDNAGQYEASGVTDANGNYCVAVLGGTNDWYCSPDNSDPSLAGYIVSSSSNTNLNAGQALRRDFTALAATAQISGHVQDRLGNPVVGIGIISSANIGGVDYSGFIDTDSGGNFSLSAANGAWSIFANCCGPDGLDNFGLTDPGQHFVSIPPTNAVVNLTLYPYGTPVLSQPQRAGPSSFGFILNGAPGTNYTIQASTNLAAGNWFTLQVVNLPGNYFFIQDNQATNSQRFYRVKMGL